jgi:SNF2 family DNA or RNA helicase
MGVQSYSIFFDLELVELDAVPIPTVLKELISDLDNTEKIVFIDEDNQEYVLSLDLAEEMLTGRGIRKFFKKHKTNYFRIKRSGDNGSVFYISDFWGKTTDQVFKTEAEKTSFNLVVNEVIKQLVQPGFSQESFFNLKQMAVDLSFQKGFDNLLSLSVLRDFEPFDYQLKTARKVLQDTRGRALLADEVGLGKTIEAGLIMTEYIMRRLCKKILILTPPSLVRQWKEEMRRKFNLEFVAYDSNKFNRSKNGWEEFDWVIASLFTAKGEKSSQYIEKIEYDLVIVDEAHHLKNRNTLNWKFVSKIKKKFILLLTATPVQNKLEELFNLITLLKPGQLETASEFKKKYITRGDRLKPKNSGELKKLVREVMVRNKRSSNKILLKKRYARVIDINLSKEEQEFYQELSKIIRTSYLQDINFNKLVLKTMQRELGSSVKAVLPTLKKIMNRDKLSDELYTKLEELYEIGKSIINHAKLEALIQLVDNINDKAIIFTSYRHTQDFLVKALLNTGISVALFHGQMRRTEKEKAITEFRNDKKVLVSTESGGEGRNLQFCNKMINFDLPWNPMSIEQRIGRIHRIGQKRDVYIYNLSAKSTIEAHILSILDAKINMFELVIGELDMILGNLNEKRDFADIIMDIWVESRDEQELTTKINLFGNELLSAKQQYEEIKQYDEELFGEMLNDE